MAEQRNVVLIWADTNPLERYLYKCNMETLEQLRSIVESKGKLHCYVVNQNDEVYFRTQGDPDVTLIKLKDVIPIGDDLTALGAVVTDILVFSF